MAIASHAKAHLRLLSAVLFGLLWLSLSPTMLGPVARCLLAWNVTVWTYLFLVGWLFWRADPHHIRRVATAQAESATSVLAIGVVAAVVSIVGMGVELSAAKLPNAPHTWPHVLLALLTVLGAWLLVPTLFSLTYASRYFGSARPGGLEFPGAQADFAPDYGDFLYFAFTIAVASQTADVAISSQAMRRLVLAQAVLSFAFNTAILALTINVAASLF